MRDYCHRLPEYEDVGEGSKPLHIDKILKVLGKTSAEVVEGAVGNTSLSTNLTNYYLEYIPYRLY